jgi:hypothetical protein
MRDNSEWQDPLANGWVYPRTRGEIWIGNDSCGPPQRLIDAFLRGEVTVGGLAEAGWFVVGRIAGDGPQS